jgi:hypothetical protein
LKRTKQADFAHHMHGRAQEQIERAGHHAFGGVFHAHHAVLGRARSGGVEDFVEVGAVNQVGRTAKKLNRRLFAKRALRAQHRHALGRFEGQAGRHDFAPDGGDVFVFERTGVGLCDLVDDLRHAVGAEERRAFGAFDLADFFGHMGALVQQVQQLFVQRVNLHTQSA